MAATAANNDVATEIGSSDATFETSTAAGSPEEPNKLTGASSIKGSPVTVTDAEPVTTESSSETLLTPTPAPTPNLQPEDPIVDVALEGKQLRMSKINYASKEQVFALC